ncbi:unnamed protein product [Dibothriocephalus latus]|uniref:Tyrosine specific protein phosphatases domain-containing protein n=1 Tax=Dibothriocephalus latus TaxID=60516 RepID=A0A3P6TIR4_DIBLA|nr:unnamed protein product [Dibothriocephalus latus]
MTIAVPVVFMDNFNQLLKEAKFYISLAYGTSAYFIGARTWYDRISEYLILGGLPVLSKWDEFQKRESITHVVSMLEPFEVKSFVLGSTEAASRGLEYLSLPVDEGVEFIDSCRKSGSSVYVHCKAGRTRSAFLVACYFMSRDGLSPTESTERIRANRKHILLPDVHMKGLQRYHHILQERQASRTGMYHD